MIDTVCRPLVLALLSQNVAVRIGGHSLPLCGAGRGVPGSWASDHVSAGCWLPSNCQRAASCFRSLSSNCHARRSHV